MSRWPGSVHDNHILRCFHILQYLEVNNQRVEDGLILGDSGYDSKSFLMTPYMRPSRPYQDRFNRVHTRTRCCIERCFAGGKKGLIVFILDFVLIQKKCVLSLWYALYSTI